MATARLHFQEELKALEGQCLGALDLVVATLDRTLEALDQQDVELASIVIADDDRIDGRYLEVQQGILSLLALQAPVASDLRVVAALLHVIKHAERMGDQCVNIAKLLPLVGHEPPKDDQLAERIATMGRLARSEVAQSKQAFFLRDVQVAEDLVRQDERINRLVREVEIRPDQFQAFVGEASLDLTRREFELIQLLAEAEGQVLEREEIYQRVWGYAMAHGDRSVDVFVRKLRQKLERASPDWEYIHTHFGVGYRFDAERLGEPESKPRDEPPTELRTPLHPAAVSRKRQAAPGAA